MGKHHTIKECKRLLHRAETMTAQRASGMTYRAIANAHGLSTATVKQAIDWKAKYYRARLEALKSEPDVPPFIPPEIPLIRLKVNGWKKTLDEAAAELQRAAKGVAILRRAYKQSVKEARAEYNAKWYPSKLIPPKPKAVWSPPPEVSTAPVISQDQVYQSMINSEDYKRVFGAPNQ